MDRQKVIKAAEICLRYIDEGDCPTECPYFDLCTKYEKRVVFQPLIRDALAMLKEQNDCENCAIAIEDRQPVVRCRECRYSIHYYGRFNNQYVCKRRMDAFGKIPEADLKGHNGNWFCADGEMRSE